MRCKALEGLKVVEYGHWISAPFCARLLADMGADVIKVETGDGDLSRQNGPFPRGRFDREKSGLFLYVNCNKKGVHLDLNTPEDMDRLLSLIAGADVFIENQNPGAVRIQGLDYATLSKINPTLIMTSITPFGQKGPYRDWKAYDLNCCAASGTSWVLGYPDREPLSLPFGQSEFQGAYNGAAATIAALLAREKTGKGQHVDISVAQVMSYYTGTHSVINFNRGLPWARAGRRMRAGIYPSGLFPCKDGSICIATPTSYQWRKIMKLMGHKELMENPRFQDAPTVGRAYPEEADVYFMPWVAQFTREELSRIALENGFTLARINTIEELLGLEHYRKRGFWVGINRKDLGEVTIPGLSFTFSVTPWQIHRPPPFLGEHNREIDQTLKKESEKHTARTVYSDPIKGPLEGCRVLDFGWNWAGPMVGQIFGDMGAEVIKVETRARMDFMRFNDMLRPFFRNINRSKLDICVDVKKPEGLELVRAVAKTSDVVLDNFSAGVMEKLGLGYGSLAVLKPDIIVLSMSMAGQTGPLKGMRGFASNATAFGGLEGLVGYPDEGSTGLMSFAYGDVNYAIQATYACLAALYYRGKSGKGQFIDISQIEAVGTNLGEPVLNFLFNHRVAGPQGNAQSMMCPHGIYPSKGEDQWISVAVATEEEWSGLCRAMERIDLLGDERFANRRRRKKNEKELHGILSQWAAAMEPWEATELLQEKGVAAFPVLSIEQRNADSHFRDRGLFEEVDHPEYGKTIIYNTPWQFSELKGVLKPTPTLGQHNTYVFEELLGMSREEITRLEEKKVIY